MTDKAPTGLLSAAIRVTDDGWVNRLSVNGHEATLSWCATHTEPVWVYGDGSFTCPYDLAVESRNDHALTAPPWVDSGSSADQSDRSNQEERPMTDSTPTSTFYRKCAEVAKRLELNVDHVVEVFDMYEAITAEWGRAALDSGSSADQNDRSNQEDTL